MTSLLTRFIHVLFRKLVKLMGFLIKVLSFCYVYIQFQLMYLFDYIIFR